MQKCWQNTSLIKLRSLNFSEIRAAFTVFFVQVPIEATVFLDIFRADHVPNDYMILLDTVGIGRLLPLF